MELEQNTLKTLQTHIRYVTINTRGGEKMKDRDKMMLDIVKNTLELMTPNNDQLNILIEDFENMQVVEVKVKLKIIDLERK